VRGILQTISSTSVVRAMAPIHLTEDAPAIPTGVATAEVANRAHQMISLAVVSVMDLQRIDGETRMAEGKNRYQIVRQVLFHNWTDGIQCNLYSVTTTWRIHWFHSQPTLLLMWRMHLWSRRGYGYCHA
jgi:hypothetical protein